MNVMKTPDLSAGSGFHHTKALPGNTLGFEVKKARISGPVHLHSCQKIESERGDTHTNQKTII